MDRPLTQRTRRGSLKIIMDKYQKLAAETIDEVENAIRQATPEVEVIASRKEGNTLLYDEAYYDLEDYVASILREQMKMAG